MTVKKQDFNNCFSHVKVAVEHAFGHLMEVQMSAYKASDNNWSPGTHWRLLYAAQLCFDEQWLEENNHSDSPAIASTSSLSSHGDRVWTAFT